jgi:hypothetical protein
MAPHLALELGDIAGCAQKSGEVPPCRGAPHADPLRIKSELLRMGAEPADRGLAVVDLSWKGSLVTQTVINACHSVALPKDLGCAGVGFVPAFPAPSMDPNHHGKAWFALPQGKVEVEPQGQTIHAGVLEIAKHLVGYLVGSG